MYNQFMQQQNPNIMYNANRPQAKFTQPLSKEDIAKLRNKGGGLSLTIDETELLKSYCTHKQDGVIVLNKQADGSLICPICGETFNEVNMDESGVREAVNIVTDILQNVKTFWIDVPEQSAKEYYPIIPLLQKLPKVYKVALDNFAKYETGNPMMQGGNTYGFNMLNSIVNPQMQMPYNMYAQQQQAYPQQNMMPYAQQAYPQQNMMPYQSNGFGYYDQQQAAMMQNAAANQQQQQQVQQPAPQQTAQAGSTVVNNKVFGV